MKIKSDEPWRGGCVYIIYIYKPPSTLLERLLSFIPDSVLVWACSYQDNCYFGQLTVSMLSILVDYIIVLDGWDLFSDKQ